MIKLKNIAKSYGKKETKQEVLRDINLEVSLGEGVAIMGTSGSGKSTLLNIIGCIDNFDSGEYLLENKTFPQNLSTLSKIRNEKISFVMQNFALIDEFTVLENVILPLNFRKISKKKKQDIAMKYLKEVEMDNFAKKKVADLSGGQKQRIAIARSLSQETDIIIADEPTGSLDIVNTENIIKILKKLQKDFEKTIIVVTHDKGVAKEFNKIYLLENGKLTLQ